MVLVVKHLPASAGGERDACSIPGSGRSAGGGPGHPLQCSCLENAHGQRSLASYSPWGGEELDTLSDLVCTHTCLLFRPGSQKNGGAGSAEKGKRVSGFCYRKCSV